MVDVIGGNRGHRDELTVELVQTQSALDGVGPQTTGGIDGGTGRQMLALRGVPGAADLASVRGGDQGSALHLPCDDFGQLREAAAAHHDVDQQPSQALGPEHGVDLGRLRLLTVSRRGVIARTVKNQEREAGAFGRVDQLRRESVPVCAELDGKCRNTSRRQPSDKCFEGFGDPGEGFRRGDQQLSVPQPRSDVRNRHESHPGYRRVFAAAGDLSNTRKELGSKKFGENSIHLGCRYGRVCHLAGTSISFGSRKMVHERNDPIPTEHKMSEFSAVDSGRSMQGGRILLRWRVDRPLQIPQFQTGGIAQGLGHLGEDRHCSLLRCPRAEIQPDR